MLVKICGITTQEAADTAAQAGADFVGFVFAPSKRQIEPAHAAAIASELPSSVSKVGVFVNEPLENVKQIAKQVGLDFIQLHGDETPAYANALPYRVIKAFSVEAKNVAVMQTFPCDYYLLDSPIGPNRGGNGMTFDWTLLSGINLTREKVILAGGLIPKNVQKAITTAMPGGVDVSSGVETDGNKDPSKIKHFIAKAKRKEDQIDNLHNA